MHKMEVNMKITIDGNANKIKFDRFWQDCVGGGYAPLALREDYRNHLRDARNNIGFNYFRIHGIFHDNMGVYSEDKQGNPIYNWTYVDKFYDFLQDIGMKPFVELGFMPEALMSEYGTHFWWKAITTPPKSYDKWYSLVKEFVIHLIERYGLEEVLTWRFEVWNEPNLVSKFWYGTQEEYFKLYEYSAKAVKDVDSRLIVGGPAIAGGNPSSWSWIKAFIEYCRSNNVPFDFISSHSYDSGMDFTEGVQVRKLNIKDRVINSVEGVRKIMDEMGVDVPLHYTEWGSCTTLFDIIQDMEFTAPFILRNIKRVQGKVDSFSYWTHSDVFEEQGIAKKPFENGFGLININGLRKAAFNSYVMLNMLGENEIKTECEDAFVTFSENEEKFQVLLWNYEPLKEIEAHDKFEYNEEDRENVELSFKNIEGNYKLERYQIDKYHSNVFQKWVEMGKPQYPSREQMKELSSKMDLEKIKTKDIALVDGKLLNIEIPRCSAVLLVFSK